MEEINLLIWNSSQSQRIIWLEEGLCFQRDARSYYYDQFSSHLYRLAELMSPNLSAAEFPCRRLFLLALLPLSFLLSFLDPQPRTTVHYLIIFTSVSCVKKKKKAQQLSPSVSNCSFLESLTSLVLAWQCREMQQVGLLAWPLHCSSLTMFLSS